MSNPLVGPANPEDEPTAKKGLKVVLPGIPAKGQRAFIAMAFMATAGIMLLAFTLGATWYNGSLEPPTAVPIDTTWAEAMFDKVLVAFLGMLAFTRERATN